MKITHGRAGCNEHLAELKVACDPNHPAHAVPPPLPSSKKVLDVGCGAGQTMIAIYPDRVTHGLDVDFEALQLGRSLTDKVRFVCGTAEALPYASEHFDMVVARVSLIYSNVPEALSEIRRVLRKGGETWMTLHPFSMAWEHAQGHNWKGWIFFGYVLINSLLFHWFQRQFSIMGWCESFQTERGIYRALQKQGFENISIKKSRFRFIVTAQRK